MTPEQHEKIKAAKRRYSASLRGRMRARALVLTMTREQHERRKEGRRRSYHKRRFEKWLACMQKEYGIDPANDEDINFTLKIHLDAWSVQDMELQENV